MIRRTAFLYADNGLVASTDPVWMQGTFETLTGLFVSVCLRKNNGKKAGII